MNLTRPLLSRGAMRRGLCYLVCACSACLLPDVRLEGESKDSSSLPVSTPPDRVMGEPARADAGAVPAVTPADAGPASQGRSQTGTNDAAAHGGAGGAGGVARAGAGGADAEPSAAAGQPAMTEPPKPAWLEPELIDVGSSNVQFTAVARNLAGDLVVSWWQDEPTGFLWMRRFMNGAWDRRPYGVTGDSKPTKPWYQSVWIEGNGLAQVLYWGASAGSMGARSTMYWTSWRGTDTASSSDTIPSIAGITFANPLLLAVTEAGESTAVFVGYPSAGLSVTDSIYMSTRRNTQWDTPRRIGRLEPAALCTGVSNSSGGFAVVSPVPATDTSNGSFASVIRKGDTITTPPARDLPERFQAGGTVAIDSAGNVTALFILIDAANTPHAYFSRYTDASKVWSPVARVSDKVVSFAGTGLSGSDAAFLWFEPTDTVNHAVGRFVTRRYSDDTGLGDPQVISPELTVDGNHVGTHNDSSTGPSALAFIRRMRASDGSETRVLSAIRSTPSGGWGPVETVATYSGTASIVNMTMSNDGRAMILWEHAEPGSVQHFKSSRSL